MSSCDPRYYFAVVKTQIFLSFRAFMLSQISFGTHMSSVSLYSNTFQNPETKNISFENHDITLLELIMKELGCNMILVVVTPNQPEKYLFSKTHLHPSMT